MKSSCTIIAGLFAIAISAPAEALDADCSVPLAVVCEVSDAKGFAEVRVRVDFGDLGQIDVVQKSFPACATSTSVSWDPIVPNFTIFATECPTGMELTLGGAHTRAPSMPTVAGVMGVIAADGAIHTAALRPPSSVVASGAADRIARSARLNNLSLDASGSVNTESRNSTTTAVPITSIDAEDDITFPVEVLVYDVNSGRSDAPRGTYRVRLEADEYGEPSRVVFLDEAGETARDLQAEFGPIDPASDLGDFDLSLGDAGAQLGKVCGKKKCFVWQRLGFLHWKFGCTNKFTGKVVACAGG